MQKIAPHEIDLSGQSIELFIWQLRFWSKVDRNGGPDACWLWKGATSPYGHGIFARYGRKKQGSGIAHRIAYELLTGPIPTGMKCCHRCDVPACVNPRHIFLGTQADNMRDMWSKGRGNPPPRNDFVPIGRKGEEHHAAKLTEDKVLEIKRRRIAGENARALAEEFGVSFSLVYLIAKSQAWSHLGGPQ